MLEQRVPAATLERLVWRFAWPQIDEGVLTGAAHLVKAPFSLHSASLRVALPLNAAALAACDPRVMPTPRALAARDASACALLAQAVVAFAVWLDTCGYPARADD